jgi:hypothetical protein
MKKTVVITSFCLLSALMLTGNEARAAVYQETFLGGGRDGTYFDVYQDWTARFAFNLATPGETATLYDNHGTQQQQSTPTTDEIRFVPYNTSITSAVLGFTFSSSDQAMERVTIKTGFSDGNSTLWIGDYTLGNIITDLLNLREYGELKLDLIGLGYRSFLEDGRFVSFVIAPDFSQCSLNDIRIDMADLTVNATPTPVPAAAWLLASGLFGLAGLRRRQA